MSSRAKRSSILKNMANLPSTSSGRVSPVASLPSSLKTNKKIEFHRKKSIKEFDVGEDVDTIWGNSYEVSIDGTPSGGLEDVTLANNSTNRSKTDDQNKENQTVNQPFTVDSSVRNNASTSWDPSITIADDERRKIRNETSAIFSQSLNATERLLVEPFVAPQAPEQVKLTLNDRSIDIDDNEDVQAEPNLKDTSQKQKPSIRSSWRTDKTGRPTVLGASSYNVSETWNSHPHARLQERMLASNRVSGDLANVSSDVDTTIVLKNAMAKVLQSRSNESIQKATNMELDESTTTLPTNALSRARPSFIPSNQRTEDDSQNVRDQTPTNIKQEVSTLSPATGRRIDTQSVDISPSMEGHIQRDSLSLDNLSIFTDMKQAATHEESTKHEGDKSPAENKCEGAVMDFGLSALSLKLRLSSPETPVVVKPRIVRPTLPIGMLETLNPSEARKMDTKDEHDPMRSVKHTPGTVLNRQHKTTSEDWKEKELVGKQSLVPMDISTRRHTYKRSQATIYSRTIVDMVDSPKQSQNYRGTIFNSPDIEIDRVELQRQNSEKQRHRGTVLCDDEMELTALVPAVIPPSNNAGRRTNYVQQPIHDETAHIQRPSGTTPERMKRGTNFGTIPIDESTDYSPPSPQTALDNYRKTVYTEDKMKEDVPVVPRREDPGRKTIVCNESMVLDVCAQTPNVKPRSESSMSCVVYGRNVAELSIHTTHGNNAVDMKFVRPTTFQPEPCDESAHVVAGRQTLMQEENMIVSEGTACAKSRRERFRAHVTHAFEEDETRCDYAMKNDTVPSRKSIFKPEEMDITVVKETDATSFPEEFKEIGCLITQATEGMNESSVHVSGVRMEANEHTGQQECMDVHKTLLEGNNTNLIKSHQQSIIPRLTTHLPEDIQREEHVAGKPRYTIYDREDMDVTKLDCGTVPKGDNPDEYTKNYTIHPTSQHKSRYTIYEHEAMNATNVCEGHGRESHTGCADLANKMQHDVTNYNTFLDHHETSHGSQLLGTAVTNPTHLQGREFNSTRLSNAYERDNFSASSRVARASSYRVGAMDETNTSPSKDTRKNFSENKTTITDARFDSPMHMSPVAGISRKSTVRHNSRQSSYYPEEMESTQIGEMKAGADRSTCIQSFGLRKTDLQRIARESDSADMEGISVLESDPTESKLEKYVTCTTEAQRNIESPVVETKQKQFKGPPNSRLSCYAAAAMVEETVPINIFTQKQGQSSTSDVRANYGGATSKERKSNDCMEVTIVPENIRVERDVMYDTDRSHNRISDTVDDSPAAVRAKYPPMIDQHRSTHGRATIYGTEETMELTAAMNQAVEEKSNRQTIHQPANMELIFTGRETVSPPPQRGTIYNVRAMEETPPNGGVSAVVDTKVQNNVSTIVRSLSLPEPEHRLLIAERLSRRPRQTILIPQDMDVESEEDGELPGEEQSSFAPSLLARETTARVHAQVLGSPMTNRPLEVDQDPLQMTNVRQTLHMHMEHTPQGPFKKRPRKSGETPKVLPAAVVEEQASFRDDIEEVLIKEERQTLTSGGRASQTLINDPSVFMIEDQNLLDDESDLPCASLSEELQPDNDERTSHKNSSTPPPSISRPPVCMLTELSYYRNFANLMIDTFDSYDEELLTPAAEDVGETPPQGEAPKPDNLVVECISVSDEDSLIVTPPKAPCTSISGNQQPDEVLDSTIASKIMYEIRLKHPVVKHPCCGMQTECLCKLRRELKRQQEMSDLMWNQWCTKFETIKQRMSKVSHAAESQDEEKPRVPFEEQVEELNWRLIRGQVDDDFLFVKGELSMKDLSRRRSRTIINGHYPETPRALFLVENFRSYLSEQLYVDSSPPPGAPLPKIPRITQLVANKLSTDTGNHWLLDCWDDGDGLLLLRHRTLQSFVISIQLQPPRSGTRTVRDITESWRLERIQVRECMEEYVHSPKSLLAHIEFMRVAKETTERTLRSTYRTVADLMGLWQHFHELLKRVLDGVNRLVAIIRNNNAQLCYDAQMERFYVKKCVHRAQDGEVNTLLVHFNSIGSIEASGVSFKCPKPELSKLLPVTASAHQHTGAPGNFMQGVGTKEKKGLMFLECLLWNVVKHYDS